MSEWRSRVLPDYGEPVLVTDGEKVAVALYQRVIGGSNYWRCAYDGPALTWEPTHWMQIPQVPKKD